MTSVYWCAVHSPVLLDSEESEEVEEYQPKYENKKSVAFYSSRISF